MKKGKEAPLNFRRGRGPVSAWAMAVFSVAVLFSAMVYPWATVSCSMMESSSVTASLLAMESSSAILFGQWQIAR